MEQAGARLPRWRVIASAFLPFAAGYYLAYVFRSINTLIASRLASDLKLGAADLGLLTSVYFLVVTGAQIPLGMLLDRFGPRRVQSVLLLIAACGAELFGLSTGFLPLLIARAMIGLGVATALMAGLKTIVTWFPRERVALINGYMIMLGALGAVTATAPAEVLLNWIGWRDLFEMLAVASATLAALIYFVVPERTKISETARSSFGLKVVFSDARFWRIAPLSATCIGSAWALQSLWAAPWLRDVDGLHRTGLVARLFIMAVAVSAGALLLGKLADWTRSRGQKTEELFAIVGTLFIASELVLILHPPLPSLLPWCIVSVVGSATALSYAIIADYFPTELAARANACLNVMLFAWAFIVQSGTGLILQEWPAHNGHYPVAAYQVAFGLNATVQVIALVWFAVPWSQSSRWRLRIPVVRSEHTRDPHSAALTVAATEIGILEANEGVDW